MFCKKRLRSNIQQAVDLISVFCNKHPVLILTASLFTTALAVFAKFLFSGEVFIFSDIGCDTKDVYYPFFVSLSNKLSGGDFSMFDLTYGLGTNIITRQADIGSPFTWIIALFPEKIIPYMILLTHIAKVIISGYFCYLYLGCFKFSKFSQVLVSYIFAFNGFTMLWGQHYFFGTFCMYFVLLLYSIEKALKNERFLILVAAVSFLMMFNSFYLAYMGLSTAGVYTLIRLFYIYTKKDVKKALSVIIKLIGAIFVGALMSAVIFLPSVYSIISGSSRLDSDLSLFERIFGNVFYDKGTFLTVISRFFSNNLFGSKDYNGVWNYYEVPQYFFTSFTFIFSFVFLVQTVFSKKQLKNKIIKLVSFGILAVLCFTSPLSVVLNGFVAPFFRFTFIVMPVFALLFADIFDKLLNNKLIFGKAQLIIGVTISIGLLCYVILCFNHSSAFVQYLRYFYVLLICLFGLICVAMQSKDVTAVGKKLGAVLIALLIIVNVSFESFYTNNVRNTVGNTYPRFSETGCNDDVTEAVKYIKSIDKGFFRTDKTFYDISGYNDSMIQGYYPAATYNSVVNKNVIEFSKTLANYYQIGNLSQYSIINIYNKADILTAMGVKYVISQEKITNLPEYKLLKKFDTVYLYENTLCDGVAKLYGQAITLEDYKAASNTDILLNKVIIDTDEKLNTKGNSVGTVDFDTPKNSSVITGSVNAETDGYLYMAIPFEEGWSAYIDGEKTEILKANIAFSAVELKQGEHTVEFRYRTPMLTVGAIISIIGFTVFFLWIIIDYKKRRKND